MTAPLPTPPTDHHVTGIVLKIKAETLPTPKSVERVWIGFGNLKEKVPFTIERSKTGVVFDLDLLRTTGDLLSADDLEEITVEGKGFSLKIDEFEIVQVRTMRPELRPPRPKKKGAAP